MSEFDDRDDEDEEEKPKHGTINQQIQHSPVSARIPPSVARGVFSTGAIVFDGANEFILDFVQRLGAPHTVVARVVLPHVVFGQFILALRENLHMYEGRFGKPPALPQPPQPPPEQQPTITDIYEQLKLPDEMMSGSYANAVMIGHTPSEFWFDFITNFYPKSAVSNRVYLTAQQIPSVLETMTISYNRKQNQPNSNLPPLPAPGEHPPKPDEEI